MNRTKSFLNYRIRTPQLAEIPEILSLFADEVSAGRMLPRSKKNMQGSLDNWQVAYTNDEIIGCVSLVFFNQTLCEIRSLTVAETYRKNGLGKKLIEAALALAKERGAKDVLTLTRITGLFEQLNFQKSEIQKFPEKVQQDCQPCPFINRCDEITLLYKIEESVVA